MRAEGGKFKTGLQFNAKKNRRQKSFEKNIQLRTILKNTRQNASKSVGLAQRPSKKGGNINFLPTVV